MAPDLTTVSQAWKAAFVAVLLSEGEIDAAQLAIDSCELAADAEAAGIANLLKDRANDVRSIKPPPSQAAQPQPP